ncbi:MAG: TIGR03089 family protein [Mycobacteriales bacterium]
MRRLTLAELSRAVADASLPERSGDFASYIRAGVARDGAKPFITWYDDSTGERIELSYLTFANWVWKTANYLRDGLDVQPGDSVATLLPAHWQTVVVWYAAWAAGAVVTPVTVEELTGSDVAVVFAREADLPAVVAAAGTFTEVVGLSLRPMAARLSSGAPGCEDYAVAVPVHGDQFVPATTVPLSAPALPGCSGAQVLASAAAAAAVLGLTSSDRLFVSVDISHPDTFVATVGAAFDAGAGVVLSPSPAESRLARRYTDELVTVVVDH